MSIHDRFIPGRWLDDIDVNDFLNLNKKPFFKEPTFLENPTQRTKQFADKIKKMIDEEKGAVKPYFSSMRDSKAEMIDKENEIVPGVQSFNFENKVGYSESIDDIISFYKFTEIPSRKDVRKTAYQHFEEISTSEIKKMIKMELFKYTPTSYTPSFIHPDVRRIALYGTKKLLEDKKWYFKTLEKHLQSHDWMQRRISINREMDALREFEDFAKRYGVDVSNPAQNAKEAVIMTYLAILGSVIENPSVPFSMTQVLPFLDTYIENDLAEKEITEEQAQELIDHFYIKLSTIRFICTPNLIKQHEGTPQFFGETFGGGFLTKTTYRFLHSMRTFKLYPLSVRVIWDAHMPKPFKVLCEVLLNEGVPISFLNPRALKGKENCAVYPYNQFGVAGEEAALYAGACDLEKAFYLALNGGKDAKSNTNLAPIVQPTRKDGFEYEEIMSKFKEFFSYVLSTYVELVNTVIYLNEINNYHPFRFSMLSSILYYKVQFGFFNLEKVVKALQAIQQGSFKVKRNAKGWIEEIVSEHVKLNNSDVLTAQLARLIEEEISKIPIYKNGKYAVRIDQKEVWKVVRKEEIKGLWTIPPEYGNTTFHTSMQMSEGEKFADFVDELFLKDFSEISIFTRSESQMINGIEYFKRIH